MRGLALELLAVAVLAGACAHAPSAPDASADAAPVLLPPPPALPRARLTGSVTRARAAARPPWWRTVLRVVTGVVHEGAATDELSRPFDVALRADGSFVLADPDRPGVLAFGADGAFVAELTCGNHPWSAPMSVALADDGAVWVADAGGAAVVRWTAAGCAVFRPEGLQRPTGIALSGDRVAVADPPSHRILSLSLAGEVLARVGAHGEGEGQFNFPTDVAAAADGSLWIVDALNFRVAHVASDGRWLGAFGARGEEGAGLARPKGIGAGDDGRLYVADAQRDAVMVFRADGTLEYVLGESGGEPGQFAHPAGVSARGGRLVVADSVNQRAEMFELLGVAP
jgi:sugar lactone lactonase YvrE